MDVERFDDFTRALLFSTPRRTALGGVLGGAVAALLARAGTEEAEAKRKKRRRKKKRNKKKRCRGGTTKCGKQCIVATECCGGCGERQCCEGVCADLKTDLDNCGACGNACVGDACFNGACACQGGDQCPNGCFCLARRDGGFGCAGSFAGSGDCTTDADCPALGSFCSSFACIDPCLV